jgi:hypothetical protein
MPTLRWRLSPVFFLWLMLLLWPAAGARAATFTLGERDQESAIAAGRQSIFAADFDAEWQVTNPAGDTLTVMTPFHRLALAARNAAFRNDALRPRDIETLVRSVTGKLEFWATLHGTGPDFARFYAPTLLPAGQAAIRPSFVQNERTALPEGGGRYAARCLYVFPSEGLSPNGRVKLVVRTPSELEVAAFTVDLATMR